MSSSESTKFLSRSLIGALGLSAIALLGVPGSVKAATIITGSDYVVTPDSGTRFSFNFGNGLETVDFKGLAIDPTVSDDADTIIERKDDVFAPIGTTDIEVVDLSLQSKNPTPSGLDVFIGLQKFLDINPQLSLGTMTIRHENSNPNATQGTWDSSFDIKGVAIVASQGVLTPQGPNFVKTLIQGCDNNPTNYQCVLFDQGPFTASNAPWRVVPLGSLPGSNSSNFDIPDHVPHNAGGGHSHTIRPVPEPATFVISLLGIGAILGFKWKKSSR